MSKLFVATIQVLLEAENDDEACDQVSQLLGGSHSVQDWQYLSPAFHPPAEITEADAKQYFQQYGELTAPDEEEDEAPDFMVAPHGFEECSAKPLTPRARQYLKDQAVYVNEAGWAHGLSHWTRKGILKTASNLGLTIKRVGEIAK